MQSSGVFHSVAEIFTQVTSTMPSTLSRVTTVPTLTTSTRRRQPGVAPWGNSDNPGEIGEVVGIHGVSRVLGGVVLVTCYSLQ